MSDKMTVLVDFDGVIHEYSKGWHDGTAYDGPKAGAREALEKMSQRFKVIIFSTRDSDQIEEWLRKYDFPDYGVTNVKVPALCLIDDRAIRFDNWNQAFADFQMLYAAYGK